MFKDDKSCKYKININIDILQKSIELNIVLLQLNSITYMKKFVVQYYVNPMKNCQTEIAHRMHMHVGLFANQRYHCEIRYFI